MIAFAILGLFLVGSMFPAPDTIEQASLLVQQHIPDVTAASWHSVTYGIISNPGAYDPSLIAGLESLLGDPR